MRSIVQKLFFLQYVGQFGRGFAARQSALLSVLAIATEKQLPLVPIIDAFADDSQFGWRQKVRDLADMLQSGSSLPDALDAIPGLLPPEAVTAARVGADSGTLAPALRSAADRLSPRHEPTMASPLGVVIYLIGLTLVLGLVVSFVMVYIIPKFKAIFRYFDVELPELTLFIIDVSDWFVNYWWILIPLLLLAGFWLVLLCAVIAAGNRVPSVGPFRLLIRLIPRLAVPDVLSDLSVVIAAGRPLTGALTTLTGVHPHASIRKRLAKVADDVELGESAWHALLEAGLLRRREAALLSAAERVGNLPWALRESAKNIERRFDLRFKMILEFVRPTVLLCYGLIVGIVVVGLFMPVVKLMNHLS